METKDKNLIHAEAHNRADGLHQNRGNTDGQDDAADVPLGAETAKVQMQLMVPGQIEDDGDNAGNELAEYRSRCGAGNAHGGEAEIAEDQNGIENDVDDGADALGDHGVQGAAGGLQEPLKGDFKELKTAKPHTDGQIDGAAGNNFLDIGLAGHEESGAENAHQRKSRNADDNQEETVEGNMTGAFRISLTERAGHRGVDAHAEAGADGDHQRLHGECQRNGGQGVFTDLRHVDAVHNVVKRLNDHGDDHGQGHVEQQLSHGHGAQFIAVVSGAFRSVFLFHESMLPLSPEI